jgi:predicted ABC-type transport system involved in lysophospholipase L1 biosynthesis ATPase subunit
MADQAPENRAVPADVQRKAEAIGQDKAPNDMTAEEYSNRFQHLQRILTNGEKPE